MHIITFYSFKGGVGRSNLLYNVAYLLAANHRARVVISDWDLHAPGMTCLYDMQDPDGPLLRRGLVDVLTDLADEAKANSDQISDPMDLIHPTRIGRRIQEKNPDAGDIWFLPAGEFLESDEQGARKYREKVQALRPHMDGLAKRGHKDLLPWIAERVEARFANEKKQADYLLLDARTGLTEVGDLLVNRVTNRVVVVFGLNDQNIEGMGHTLRWILGDVGPANIASQVLLVVSPVPNGEEFVKHQKLQRIDDLVKSIISKAAERVGVTPVNPKRFQVPYHPLIALTEQPMAEAFPASEPAKVFDAITDYLRIRPLKPDVVQQDIQLQLREEQAANAANTESTNPSSLRTSPADEHPMARRLPWNVVNPKVTAEMLLRTKLAEGEELLNALANAVTVPIAERSLIIDHAVGVTPSQVRNVLRTLGEEYARLMALDKSLWQRLAALRGTSWVEWTFGCARRLNVPLAAAAQRLVDWLSSASGGMNPAVALAVGAELVKRPEETRDALRSLLERVVEANPKHDAYVAEAARQRILIGDIERGNEWFGRVVERKHEDGNVEFAWGFAFHQLAEIEKTRDQDKALRWFQEAEEHYRRADKLKPGTSIVENNWGNVILARAHLVGPQDRTNALALIEEAERHFHKAREIDPNDYGAENNLGLASHAQARLYLEQEPDKAIALFKEAATHYRRSCELKPDSHIPEYNWGFTLIAQAVEVDKRDSVEALRLFEEAAKHYRRAHDLKPSDQKTTQNWVRSVGHLVMRLKDHEPQKALSLLQEAEGHYRRLFEQEPDGRTLDDDLITMLLWQFHVLRVLDRPEDAKRAGAAALAFAERHLNAMGKPTYNVVCAFAVNGDHERALDALELVAKNGEVKNPAWLRKDPDLVDLQGHLRFEALVKSLEDQKAASSVS